MGTSLKGRRIDSTGDGFLPHLQGRGDYGKDDTGVWWAIAPAAGCPVANLSNHDVTEHEDGTITVSPSILLSHQVDGADVEIWHGYLERGVWRAV